MDCLILTGIVVSLLTVALQNVSGFSITDHNKNRQRLMRESPADDDNDYMREMRGNLHYIHTLQDLEDVLSPAKRGLLAVPSKRQQGWYVQYGKRTSSADKPKPFQDPVNYDFLKTIIPKASATSSESTDKQKAWFSNFLFDLDLGKHLDGMEKDPNTRGILSELLRRTLNDNDNIAGLGHPLQERDPTVWKRVQGWFTQYGKRSKVNLFS